MSSDEDPTSQRGLQGKPPEQRPHPTGRRNKQGIRIDPEAEAEPRVRKAVVSALVDNEPGVLSRVSGLFSRRQFNIESLTVGPTTVEGNARITLVVEETDPGIDQVKKQLAKLKPVMSVGELENNAVRAELVLLKVHGDEPDKVHAITQMYDGQTLDAGPRTITVQITGDESKIDDAVDAFRQFGIIEIARTGQTALARGDTPTTPGEEPAPEGTIAEEPSQPSANVQYSDD
ncbi:acetolactate synthase small subunit [Natronocalculus amylovorans]|uniref:Acetolactate synthase small subunit n=1 Tax=Natronocalculus amylovorans TaxID=2917812 RepID=A0AAE3FYI9_9EURY|nr:acetolactate synthase small subunit [Natronocalculus amylovorans]MCL9817235.1 acetolactate synthase small subunit [Natronocalculus amylovorans]NUE02736.1 acetolactate synthase small subunit [Halorubraceae archaeon YAN]